MPQDIPDLARDDLCTQDKRGKGQKAAGGKISQKVHPVVPEAGPSGPGCFQMSGPPAAASHAAHLALRFPQSPV